MGQLLAFLGISVLVIVTPGQDTALTIRNALLGGRRAGLFAALGVVGGQAVWALAASAGVAALLVASEPAFLALRVMGAAYLLVLGVQALRSALRAPSTTAPADAAPPPPAVTARVAYRQGALSNLANPKMAVFFTSLLPAFAPAGAFAALLALGAVFCLMTLAWLSAYAIAVARARHVLLRPRVRRTLDALTGTVLVALGLRIATTGPLTRSSAAADAVAGAP